MFPVFENAKLVMVKVGQASAGTDVVSDEVDTRGYEGAIFFGTIATANAGNFAKLSQALTAGGAQADLAGSKRIVGTNGNSYLIDIRRPLEPFLKCTIVRAGANTVTGDMYCLLYGPRSIPPAQGATIESLQLISPAEGTA